MCSYSYKGALSKNDSSEDNLPYPDRAITLSVECAVLST